jgi:3-deoxy-D-manno-octulosonic-acid transferase
VVAESNATSGRERRGATSGREPQGATTGRGFLGRILLVDAVGELGAWWGTAAIAFVGGSLGNRGGQNMIEPAAYGAAVAFGPNTRNFRDVVTAMLDRDAAVVVQDADELAHFVRRCLEDPAYAAALGKRAQELVVNQLGASKRTVDLLAGLPNSARCERPRGRTAA